MDDGQIIEMYFDRDERAIAETQRKFGALCIHVSMNILNDRQDSEENVNDTYMQVWNSIPPNKPDKLAPFIGRIARNLAINRYKAAHTQKRAQGQFSLSLDELDECIPGRNETESRADANFLKECINKFLRNEKQEARNIFIRRYFYCESVEYIADQFGLSESKVKSVLFRQRSRLKKFLESEGVNL